MDQKATVFKLLCSPPNKSPRSSPGQAVLPPGLPPQRGHARRRGSHKQDWLGGYAPFLLCPLRLSSEARPTRGPGQDSLPGNTFRARPPRASLPPPPSPQLAQPVRGCQCHKGCSGAEEGGGAYPSILLKESSGGGGGGD